MISELTLHIINFGLALVSFVVLILIIFRTRKLFDRAMKMFALVAATLVIATSMQINRYTELIPTDYENVIFVISRTLAEVFFLFGVILILRIVSKTRA